MAVQISGPQTLALPLLLPHGYDSGKHDITNLLLTLSTPTTLSFIIAANFHHIKNQVICLEEINHWMTVTSAMKEGKTN